MNLPRVSLRLAALAFAGFGVALLVRPALLGSLGIELGRPAAATEIRAFYGGLELGLAVFFALASTRDDWLRPALYAQAASLGGIVLARLIGFVVDGSAEPLLLLFAAVEATGVVLGAVALRRLPRGTNNGG
ncbi:protein of unknown function [bacterium JGI 053]|nr:protein of unknown function [bacterium JGI 053]